MGKVVKLKQSGLDDAIKTLQELQDCGKVTDLCLIYACSISEDPEKSARSIHSYWFGETSCLFALGLLDRMKWTVQKYIDERW